MTVRCLTETDKEYVVDRFNEKLLDINQLAHVMSCSRRTIIRVLQEKGVDPGLRAYRRWKVAKLAPMPNMHDMSDFPIMKVELIEPTPWWKRLGQAVSRVFT